MIKPIIMLLCGGVALLYLSRRWLKLLVVVTVLLLQLLWLAWPTAGHGPRYRMKERSEATRAWMENPSPTTKAAYDSERRLEGSHEVKLLVATALFLLLLDGGGIYYFWTFSSRDRRP